MEGGEGEPIIDLYQPENRPFDDRRMVESKWIHKLARVDRNWRGETKRVQRA